MRKFFMLIPVLIALQGCISLDLSPVSRDIQMRWQGRPVSELQKQMGSAGSFSSDKSVQHFYSWSRGYLKYTTIQPSRVVAGTKLVNGMYVPTYRSTPAVSTNQYVSCQFRVFVDNQNRILNMDKKNNGIDCDSFEDRL